MNGRPNRWVQLRAVARKETLQTIRDRRLMFMLVFAPLVQAVVFGYAVNFKVERVPTVIVDHDRSAVSRAHARRLLADGTLQAVSDASLGTEGDQAPATVVLPRGLARDLDRGDPAVVQVIVDGTDPNRATAAAAAVASYFAQTGQELARTRAEAAGRPAPPRVLLSPRIAFNPTMESPPYMVPGVLGLLLVVVTTIVTAMGLAREREMGTLEQVSVTPIPPMVLLVGKLLPFVVIGLVDTALVLTMGLYLFDVPLRGSPGLLLAASLLYLLTTLGVGLLISTVSRAQQQAFLGGFLFIMPAILLSGVMTPIRGMPGWLQAVTYLNPLRYYAEIMRACLLKGAGLAELWGRMTALLVIGVGIVWFASSRFQKRVG